MLNTSLRAKIQTHRSNRSIGHILTFNNSLKQRTLSARRISIVRIQKDETNSLATLSRTDHGDRFVLFSDRSSVGEREYNDRINNDSNGPRNARKRRVRKFIGNFLGSPPTFLMVQPHESRPCMQVEIEWKFVDRPTIDRMYFAISCDHRCARLCVER